ncbi:MAG: acetate kinase [Actinomycetaceae bacterium]|nr:acetate kinase [Actinomycetaceae bacterium]MDY6082888.1 acetate kinase [Actinomycetaceae bacterium]
MSVFVINSGSSSIKYQLIDPEDGEVIASGIAERIGQPMGHVKHTYRGSSTELDEPIEDHGVGLTRIIDLFDKVGPDLFDGSVKAVGHRVVQGGKFFNRAAVIDDDVLHKIEELAPLAPLHNPAHLKGIRVAKKLFPQLPQVAVFDTAFFQDLPSESATYALNREVAEKYQIRRYGAHGTSHQYVSGIVAHMLGRDDLKQIVLHIGNGASASAVVNGKAVDTSMGLTPLAGLVMGGRTGDIDPAVVFHLQRVAGMSVDDIDRLFNFESGMLGLTGESDMRSVRDLINAGDEHAREAIDVYEHRIIHYIGAYWAQMGGLDAITFTAGVGENDADVRAEVVERLSPFGIALDEAKNQERSSTPRVISTPDSTVTVLVVPTNEELAIARQAMELLS